MIDSIKLAILYTLFAVIATFCNILAQDVFSYIYSGTFYIFISIVIGTGVGLVIKYVLDKKYIFKYKTQGLKHDGQIFVIYTMMGIFTTVIFWGFEFGFHAMFGTKEMRYVGAVIGLMIGYICKYYLDKNFVFRTVKA